MKLKVGLILFLLGFIGILSMLTASLPTHQLPAEVLAQFTPLQLKLLLLVNPTILLLIAVLVGVNVYPKVNLSLPLIQRYLLKQENDAPVMHILTFGVIGGIISGIILVGVSTIFSAILPQEFAALNENIKLTPLVRILYGGLTEEILLRFGFMSFLVWLIFKISKKLNRLTYLTGIILAAILFAAAHLPIVFQSVEAPSAGLIFYIMLGNAVGGIIFGWIYWKKGLEAAFISHMFAHVVIMLADRIS